MRKLLILCTLFGAACQTTTSNTMTRSVTSGATNDEINAVNAKRTDIPVDIRPVFPAAGEK